MSKEQLPDDALVVSDGWVSLSGPDGETGVHMRLAEDDAGRLVVTDVYLHGPRITAATLRKIQPARVEAMVNLGEEPGTEDHLAVDTLTAFATSDETLTVEELRQRKPTQATPRRTDREPLGRPDRTDPDGFYQRVAAAYRDLTRHTRSPAVEMAAEAGVPVTTAHRWVREARRRGFLPPAQKGVAG
ncbi:hypothetical protein ACFOY4_33620 [Actinomadura syzygii]|uniref:Uncharacterized protein n=1 Tax=Actinomadura syzygii TaxID=1427538 RepID=A0A5D0U8V2_9ACTN|nr:hypothetical protein [Actinomadura syzygii]TYC15001.1 hypothetical protein FXF65_12790 [Actinomadura syzygii]